MNKFFGFLSVGLIAVIAGCDLQPKIASIPGSVGDFISERYPTLLAEPDSEIYKTAVADYGVYASPTVYGDGDVLADDYVLYSPADDYMMPAQDTDVSPDDVGMPDDDGADDVEQSSDASDEIQENAPDDDIDDLHIPDYVDEKPVLTVAPKPAPKKEQKSEPEKKSDAEKTPEMVRAQLREVTIEQGDTLYSVSRKYSVPVNDLAVMNKISAPFTLSVGQKIKVPDVSSVAKSSGVRVATTPKSVDVKKPAGVQKVAEKPAAKTEAKPVEAKKVATTPVKKADAPKASMPKVDAKPKATKSGDATKKTTDAKKTEVKNQARKADVKKADDKKVANKKPDANVKKSDTKKVAQKTETKKRATKQLAARSSSKFSWPVRGKILSGYGSKTNGLFNDGINIKASRGAPVLAAENGFVAYAGNEVKGMGNLVIIQHADGWMTVYAHMDSMNVRRGSTVLVGQKIGTVGTSGKVDQPQLHFEIRKGTRAYNPISYLKK